ncbi:MAG TPA: hypothetical protein VLD13_04575 [Gaiellaceae bacterium]|nr:hypothetical protein [Gaiellaceae bacterium]
MAEGNGTDNVEPRPREEPRRMWLHVQDVELRWLRISETAFLLWVLAGLVLAWLIVALLFLLL